MHRSVSCALRIPKHQLLSSRTFTPLTSRTSTPLTSLTTTHPRPAKSPTGIITPLLRHHALHTSSTRHQSPTPTSPSPTPTSPSPIPTSPAVPPPLNRHTNFYKTHGRALFKALTLAFFTYQVCYYAWMVLETEEIKDQKTQEIRGLEGEVRLLDEARR